MDTTRKQHHRLNLLNTNENKNYNNNNSVCLAVKTFVDRAVQSAWDRVRCENSRRIRDSARIIADPTQFITKNPDRQVYCRFYHMGMRRIFYVCLFV